MNIPTSVTVWNDAVGKRISISFSEVDETTGKIISDNKRADKVVTDKSTKDLIDSLLDYAQTVVEEQ